MHTTATTVHRAVAAALCGGLLASGSALAQSGRHLMIMERSDDDGVSSSMVHLTLPDFAKLRAPDYLRSDLPLFEKTLALRATQTEQVEALLEEYLAAFTAAVEEALPSSKGGGHFIDLGEGGALALEPLDVVHDPVVAHAAGEGGEGGERGDAGEIVADFGWGEEGEGEFAGQVMIGIRATSGGDVTGEDVNVDAGEGAGVMIQIEGDDLPPEVREQLEARAKEVAEQIREKLEKQQAAIDAGEVPDRDGDLLESIEQRQAHFEELARRAEAFQERKAALAKEFEGRVRAELDDGQLGRWPDLQRTLTRHKTLPNSRLSGESVDLVRLLDQLGLSEDQRRAVREEEQSYAISLHEALLRRNAFVDDASRRVDEAIQTGDTNKALSITDRATELRLAVRNINQRYAEALASVLPTPESERFRQRVREESYPRVYRPNVGLRAFEKARRLEGVDEEKVLAILELEASYRRELEETNRRIRQVIDREEPDEARRAIEHVAATLSGQAPPPQPFMGGEDPIRDALAERRELDDRYMARLYAMLTPDQVAALPTRPSQRKNEPIIIRSLGEPQ